MTTTKQGEATGRPWRVGDAGATVFGPPTGEPAPRMVAQRTRKADAAVIVRAVNAHEGLVAALETVGRVVLDGEDNPNDDVGGEYEMSVDDAFETLHSVVQVARAALAVARGDA